METLEIEVMEEQGFNPHLANKTLIVDLSISQWTARKYDHKVSKEVEDKHQAKDAGRYNKALVSKKYLENIQKVVSKARVYHYEQTLPWGDDGKRILPTTSYFDYIGEMNNYKSEFFSAVDEFVDDYNHAITDAKDRLKDMFNERDYPSDVEIRGKFDFHFYFDQIRTTDFRVNLSKEELSTLKETLETEINNRLNSAVRSSWARIKDQLEHMLDRLSDNKSSFKNSLFDNLTELVELLPKLNITNDPNITTICDEMRNLVADPETIRLDRALRAQKAKDVETIINKFKDFF